MAAQTDIQELFETGAHYGFSRSRRHPSADGFIFGTKDRNDIFDLEETAARLKTAQEFVAKLASEGKQVLFVGGKHEAEKTIADAAQKCEQPYVIGRWIGGTLTNFKQIRKRIDRLEKLLKERESGERDQKYTKLERLKLDREIDDLESKFGGLKNMMQPPAALFVVDPRHEETAVTEAKQLGIPVVALASSDCDFGNVQYPIPANDSAIKSIRHFVSAITNSYSENKKAAPAPAGADA